MEPGIKSPSEIAQMLRISRRKIIDEVKSGKIKAIRVGNQIRVFEADLQEYLNKKKSEAKRK